MSTLAARYSALSRPMKWVVWFVAFLAFYFGVVEQGLNWVGAVQAQADTIETNLAKRARTRASVDNSAGSLERNMIVQGPFRPIGSNIAAAQQGLERRIAAVKDAHNITEKRRNTRTDVPLDKPANTSVKSEYVKVVIDLTVECPPPEVNKLLADLEKASEVSAISKVEIRKVAETGGARNRGGESQLNVSLSVEAWVKRDDKAGKNQSGTVQSGTPTQDPPRSQPDTQPQPEVSPDATPANPANAPSATPNVIPETAPTSAETPKSPGPASPDGGTKP